MAIKPLDDRLVVEVSEATTMTAGGIVLPDTAKEKPQEGTVQAIGQGRLLPSGSRADMAVKKGDRVLFGKYAGTDVKVDGKEYKILREGDLLARYES